MWEVAAMGLSSPGRLVSMESDGVGIVEVNGQHQRVRLALLIAAGAKIAVDDWLLVQRGLAVALLDAAEATELIRLMATVTPVGIRR
jgi:hydrogenase maturation factor